MSRPVIESPPPMRQPVSQEEPQVAIERAEKDVSAQVVRRAVTGDGGFHGIVPVADRNWASQEAESTAEEC